MTVENENILKVPVNRLAMNRISWVVLLNLSIAHVAYSQDTFVPPEELRAQLQQAYSTPDVMQAGFSNSSNGGITFDREQRSHLMEVLAERLQDMRDPEIAIAYSQMGPAAKGEKADAPPKKKAWYEKMGIRGYAQFRYNFTVDEDEDSAPAQNPNDRSVGNNQTFLLRRARLIFFGDITEHVYIYLQPDFAATPNGAVDNIQFTQIRDWFADWYFDKEKVYRLRIGSSKVPYGWENMQSSSNRLALDRNDPLNSAVKNERDMGLFFYWTPEYAQKFFSDVMDKGLKGSGNFGVFALGVYAGQGGALAEVNDTLHSVIRLTLPHEFYNGQYMEVSVQAYTGFYAVYSSQIRANGVGPLIRPTGTVETGDRRGWLDQRIAGTFVWYPQPLGFQAEWNVGQGPALNEAQNAIESKPLNGGYAQVMYRYDTCTHGILFPFTRWQYFTGGYKSERNAPDSYINEWEVGMEWQINPSIELTTIYTMTNRTNTTARTTVGDPSYQQFKGDLIRCQLQFNY